MLSRRVRWPAGLLVAAAVLCWTPGQANAAGIASLTGTLGLASALLVLLAIQSSAGALPPLETLGAALVMLTALAVMVQWGRANRAARSSTDGVVRATASCQDAGLLALARAQFVELQAAWDRGDVDALGALTTAEMLDELLCELPARGPGQNRTDVLSLEARVLALEQLGPLELASIEFSGMVCESPERGPVPFREVWMLARTAGAEEAGTWRLARQQALL